MRAKIDLDVRGLSCPEPVIRTQKVLGNADTSTVTVLADNKVAAENIQRLAKGMKYACATKEQDGEFLLTIHKET